MKRPGQPRRAPGSPAVVEQTTLSRRTVLSWLGAGATLSLAGAALISGAGAGCADDPGPVVGADGGPDGSTDGPLALDAPAWPEGPIGDGGLPFAPGAGTHPVFAGWNVRTVDPQDLATILKSWKLTVDGMVGTSKVYTFADLVGLGLQSQLTDVHCVEGWSVNDVPWNGLHLSKIFDQVKPDAKATYVAFHTIDSSYNESLPIAIAKEPRTILGLGVGGQTLPLNHGFPLRVVIPRLLGYKNAKYIQRIELTDKPLHGFWVKAGYAYDGDVPKARLRPGKY